MKTNWPTKKLGELLEKSDTIPAKIKRSDYQQNGKYPVVDQGENFIAGHIDEESKLYRGELPVIVFGDHTRIVKYIDFPFAVGADGTKILRSQETLLPKFFYYALLLNPVKNLGYKRHFSILRQVKIPLPPLEIQKQIVERLDKIAEAQKLNDNLIQKADELFQSLFHNEYEVKNNQWDSKKMQEVCEKIDQIHPKKMFKKEFSYIDIASINSDKVIRAQIVSVDKAPSRARKVVKAGDTIFSTVRPYLKHIAYIPEMLDNSIASTGFCVIRPNADLVNTLFLNYVVESDHFVRRVLPFQRGANYPAVSDKNVYDIKIPLPPLETQKQIVAKLSAVQEYKKQLLSQKSKLKELFDSVLHKSMNGEMN